MLLRALNIFTKIILHLSIIMEIKRKILLTKAEKEGTMQVSSER